MLEIPGWTVYAAPRGFLFAAREFLDVVAVAQLGPRRIHVELDVFVTATGEHLSEVSNVIRGDLRFFASFADLHLSIVGDTAR